VYHYDLEDPTAYTSNNNRLMYVEKSVSGASQSSMSFGGGEWEGLEGGGPEAMGPGGGGTELQLASTTWYYYNEAGNVTRVVTNNAGTTVYTATRLEYARNDRVVAYGLGESWSWNGNPGSNPTGYTVTYAREFRYDGARQRFRNRALQPVPLMNYQLKSVSGGDTWTDYDGDEPYGDYDVIQPLPPVPWEPTPPPYATEKRSFEPGIARAGDPFTTVGGANTAYYHGDQIGTTRLTTDAAGAVVQAEKAVYTAFGEPISGTMTSDGQRYRYAGAWGYQAEPDSVGFPFLHVGARYYDPASGRFLQRDPVGINGGANVYRYVYAMPSSFVDPEGEWGIFGFEFNREWVEGLPGDLGRGAASTIDGFIPFFDPFQYFGAYSPKTDPGTKWSKRGGRLAYYCIQGPRTVLKAKDLLTKLRPPNPGPYVPSLPPMVKGPFYGGGQTWPGG
jgi:RHS repeat-associated protein